MVERIQGVSQTVFRCCLLHCYYFWDVWDHVAAKESRFVPAVSNLSDTAKQSLPQYPSLHNELSNYAQPLNFYRQFGGQTYSVFW